MAHFELDAATLGRLTKLLDEALDRAPEQRAAWLESLAPEFAALKPQLVDLLSRTASVETADFLNTLPKFEVGSLALEVPGKQAGDLVGPYRLVRELGAGGMGSVWLAERADGLIQRPVALKLPHRHTPSAGLAERLARERAILATLDHRNIARLLDAGIAEEGQPFLALEYVEGVPIDIFCAGGAGSAPLPIAARLQLFRQVVNAVAYAHGKLIVHRDLKPANILVGAQGGVTLLDFGIAKLLDEGRTRDTHLTEIGGRALTPDYASPEQILGEPLTVASDVYSLGVIFYELVCGERPYKLRRNSRGALEDAIVEAEPRRPSELATPARRRELRGDIDTIAVKALKKDPAERYATANAFADDITRFLENRPVLARPDRAGYKLRKFVARNRVAVAAAAIAGTAVVGGVAAALWQTRIAITERDRAEEVKRFIAGVFEEADPYNQSGRALSAADLMRRAASDVTRRFADRAELRSELGNVIAASLLGLADLPDAATTAARTVDDASRTLGPEHVETLRARVLLAEAYAAQRDNPRLRAELDSLLPLLRLHAGAVPELYARALRSSGDLAIEEGRYDEAAAPMREAFALARRELGERHPVTVTLSTAYAESLIFAQAPIAEQLREADRALALALAVSEGNENSPRVLQMRDIRVRMLGDSGDLRGTVAEADRLIAAATQTFGPDSLAVGYAMMNTDRYRASFGEVTQALQQADKALEILGPRIDHEGHEYHYAFATKPVLMVAARKVADALPLIEATHAQAIRLFGASVWGTQSVALQRAHILARLGRFTEANAVLDEIGKHSVPDARRDWDRRMRGCVARWEGQYREAVALQTEAERLGGPAQNRDTRMRINHERGLAAIELGDLTIAQASLGAVEQYLRELGSPMHPVYAETLTGLARVKLQQRALREALALAERADEFWRSYDPDNREGGDAAFWLAEVQRASGSGAARATFVRAAGLLGHSPIPIDRERSVLARRAGS
jgi:eukaryotic-like serine/threonine-protein kinase